MEISLSGFVQFCYVYNVYIYTFSIGDENSARYVEPPVIPGHEFVGEVVKLGKGINVFSGLY